jgi:hypothetical protein
MRTRSSEHSWEQAVEVLALDDLHARGGFKTVAALVRGQGGERWRAENEGNWSPIFRPTFFVSSS